MKETISIEQEKERRDIDIGGTPSKIIEKGKDELLNKEGISPEQRIIILDPFDLSRAERSIVLTKGKTSQKIKIPINQDSRAELSSDYSERPNIENLIQRFEERKVSFVDYLHQKYRRFNKEEVYGRYKRFLEDLREKKGLIRNIRDLMNFIVTGLDEQKTKCLRLEEILGEQQEILLEILEYQNVRARIFCPECRNVSSIELIKNNREPFCCTTDSSSVLKSGRYIPEGPVLTAILFCTGINPLLNKNSPYLARTIDILKKVGKLDKPMLVYDDVPTKTMFESYLLGSTTK